jgi:hypothetical protein
MPVTAYTPTTTQPITNYIPVLQTAPANVARFDHNPVSGESLGLLVEELRTNLVTYSEQFDNAAWRKFRASITPNTIVAPDGTLTGGKLVEDTTASNTHLIDQNLTPAVGTYAWSVYAKAGERSFVRLGFTTASANGAYFNLANGTVGTVGAGVTASITAVGNGWYRCVAVRTTAATSEVPSIGLASADNTNAYTGDGYSGIYIWGAQFE